MSVMIVAILFILMCMSSTIIGLWSLGKLFKATKQFRVPTTINSSTDLPTVSVCVPARNETHAMTRCLEAVLASDYEKLEVIVLDDSSVDDTSVLIKSFAHEGVRFVSGETLPTGWLGKNHALHGLQNEASGSILLFIDVDTHISPTTIRLSVDDLSLIHISEPTRLGMISYAVF